MLDESLLDDPAELARADARGLLRTAAQAGAQMRIAARQAAESDLARVRPDGRPRALLVAGPGPVAYTTADLLRALTAGACPVTALRPTGARPEPSALNWTLPGWAGPYDLLLIATEYGREPGLTALVEQAYRRGCTVVAVAPRTSAVTEIVTSRGLAMPLLRAPGEQIETGGLWPLLTPLLALADRIELIAAPDDVLSRVADRLDIVAERCGPAIETYANPAKTLAAELAESLPLLWSEGPLAGVAARYFARQLAAVAGRPALPAALPDALAAHGMLLSEAFTSGADPDDIFRDRVEEPAALRARIVLLHDESADSARTPREAAPAARELASAQGTPVSELEPSDGAPLEAAGELIATADFTAVYLALAAGSS